MNPLLNRYQLVEIVKDAIEDAELAMEHRQVGDEVLTDCLVHAYPTDVSQFN